MDSKKFGEFIATIRKEKGWTQAELAEKISVTDKAVSRWERTGLAFCHFCHVDGIGKCVEQL